MGKSFFWSVLVVFLPPVMVFAELSAVTADVDSLQVATDEAVSSSRGADEKEEARNLEKAQKLARELRPKWAILRKKFHALQSRRTRVLSGSRAVVSKHVAALQMLLEEAVSMSEQGHHAAWSEDQDIDITINSELKIFGANKPGMHYWQNNDGETVTPKTLFDPRTHISYKLKADGRRVTAFSPRGKVLWSHDVFIDYGLSPYRVTKPVVVVFKLSASSPEEFEKAEQEVAKVRTTSEFFAVSLKKRDDYSKRFLEIVFNSSQFGDIDADTGEFTFGGQN